MYVRKLLKAINGARLQRVCTRRPTCACGGIAHMGSVSHTLASSVQCECIYTLSNPCQWNKVQCSRTARAPDWPLSNRNWLRQWCIILRQLEK